MIRACGCEPAGYVHTACFVDFKLEQKRLSVRAGCTVEAGQD